MATQGPTALPAFFSSAADFEAWITGIHNALSALGFVQTADTGQINPATVALPSSTQAASGYEIWRFADTLQATVPVFFKIEYGSGNATNAPGLWITVGSGTNGAGGLTGQVSGRFEAAVQTSKSAGVTLATYASNAGDGSGLALVSNIDPTSSLFGMLLYVGRTRDQNGNPTSDGVVVLTSAQWQGTFFQYLPASGGPPGSITNSLPAVPPWFLNRGTGGENADVCPLLLPISGQWRYAKFLVTGLADFGALGTFTTVLFGTSHTFLALNNGCGNLNFNPGNGGNVGLAIPWE